MKQLRALKSPNICKELGRNEIDAYLGRPLSCLRLGGVRPLSSQSRRITTTCSSFWSRRSKFTSKPRVEHICSRRKSSSLANGLHQCFVALGSNMNGRIGPIEVACRAIDRIPDTRIVRTSGLWNTQAMYVTSQPDFLNGVCEVSCG
jgi:hypothetical protein